MNQLSEFVRRKRTMNATAARPARNETTNPTIAISGCANKPVAFRASSSVFAPPRDEPGRDRDAGARDARDERDRLRRPHEQRVGPADTVERPALRRDTLGDVEH